MESEKGGSNAPGSVFSSLQNNLEGSSGQSEPVTTPQASTAGMGSVYPQPTKGFAAGVVSGGLDKVESEELLGVTSSSSTAFGEVSQGNNPVPVVKVLSVRGVEYWMMSIALWFGAASIIWILLSLIYGMSGFKELAFPVSVLVVVVPIFSFLFLRLRKQELENPELRFEASKRRMSQTTQFFAFFVCVVNLITFVYMLVSAMGGDSKQSLLRATLGMLAILLIAGGILLYYWFDEHRIAEK